MKTAKLIPARTLGIGFFIREQLECRGWNINVLSNKSGIDSLELNSLLENGKYLTIELAKALANIFGSSYQYWLNLDSNYKRNARTID